MKYLTAKEINVLGVQRTGQHAIASWLIGHFDNVCYRNGMTPLNERKRSYRGVEPPWWYFSKNRDSWTVSGDDDIVEGMDAIILGTELTSGDIRMNPKLQRQKDAMADRCGVDGFSERQDYVLVIRNPFNHYASVLTWKYNRRLRWPKQFSRSWVAVAKEVLGETNIIPKPLCPVVYDQWFQSIDYRKELSNKLSLNFNDKRLNTVMKIGQGKHFGSSFDKMKKEERGQQMDVLNRWKTVQHTDEFKDILKRDDLIHYAKELGFDIP